MQRLLHVEKFRCLRLHQPGDRDSGPAEDDVSDLVLAHNGLGAILAFLPLLFQLANLLGQESLLRLKLNRAVILTRAWQCLQFPRYIAQLGFGGTKLGWR